MDVHRDLAGGRDDASRSHAGRAHWSLVARHGERVVSVNAAVYMYCRGVSWSWRRARRRDVKGCFHLLSSRLCCTMR